MALHIVGSKTWHLHIIGEVPPGVDPGLMEATVVTSYAIIGGLFPYVRGQFVQVHDIDVETLRQQLAMEVSPRKTDGM